jgi:hypothetical protein
LGPAKFDNVVVKRRIAFKIQAFDISDRIVLGDSLFRHDVEAVDEYDEDGGGLSVLRIP